jgi:hypothetical protein
MTIDDVFELSSFLFFISSSFPKQRRLSTPHPCLHTYQGLSLSPLHIADGSLSCRLLSLLSIIIYRRGWGSGGGRSCRHRQG